MSLLGAQPELKLNYILGGSTGIETNIYNKRYKDTMDIVPSKSTLICLDWFPPKILKQYINISNEKRPNHISKIHENQHHLSWFFYY